MSYAQMIAEQGWTDIERRLRPFFESNDDIADLPGHYMVALSAIDGLGIFATVSLNPGDRIGPARIGDKRSLAGRYANHSDRPNAKMARIDGDLYLIAKRPIRRFCEITVDYRQVFMVNKELHACLK